MEEVVVAHILRGRNTENFRSSPTEGVDQGGVGVVPEPIKVFVVEELLEAPINPVWALVGEQEEVLRGCNKAIVAGGTEEVEVSVLKGEGRPMGSFDTSKTRKATTERRSQESGGRNNAECVVRRGVCLRNGFEGGFESGFGGYRRASE